MLSASQEQLTTQSDEMYMKKSEKFVEIQAFLFFYFQQICVKGNKKVEPFYCI